MLRCTMLPFWDHHGTTEHRRRPRARCRAQLQSRNQALGVPQSGRHDSKPEGGRLTANAITGLKPRRASYDVTDPGGAGVQLRVMPSGTKRRYFRFYWRNKRQRLGLGLWPAVGLALARGRLERCSMRASTRARRGSSRERAHAPNRLYGTRLGPSHTRSRLSRPSGLLLIRFRISGGTYGFVGRSG